MEYRDEVRAALEADYAGEPCNEDMIRLIELGVKLGLEAAANTLCLQVTILPTGKKIRVGAPELKPWAEEIASIDPRAVLGKP